MNRDTSFSLSLHRYLMRAAHALTGAFLWVILFLYFLADAPSPAQALIHTALLYALAQVITLLTAPLAMKLMRGNMLRGVIYGTVIGVAAFVYLGALTSGVFVHGTAMAGILLGLYRAFYRTPYILEHQFFVRDRGPHVLGELILAFLPTVGGVALLEAPSALIFYAAAFLSLIALIPLFFAPQRHEHYSWEYRETFAQLLDERNKALMFDGALVGIKSAALFVLWPFVILFIFHPSPAFLGGIFSLTLIIILLFRSSASRTGAEPHADNATYVDEYTILKEMALALGRLFIGLGLGILAAFFAG